jgi:hypothetical protein
MNSAVVVEAPSIASKTVFMDPGFRRGDEKWGSAAFLGAGRGAALGSALTHAKRHPGESRDPRTPPVAKQKEEVAIALFALATEFMDPGFRRGDERGAAPPIALLALARGVHGPRLSPG